MSSTTLKPGDKITARFMGQYVTFQRCEWVALHDQLKVGSELAVRVVTITLRDADPR